MRKRLEQRMSTEQHQQFNMDLHEVKYAAYLERASIAAYAVVDAKQNGLVDKLDSIRSQREHWLDQARQERELCEVACE